MNGEVPTIPNSLTTALEGAQWRDYLKEYVLTDAMLNLARARHRAGLSQAELAEKLNTKQPVISRSESDLEGSISLRRYVDWLFACGTTFPRIDLASLESARVMLTAQESGAALWATPASNLAPAVQNLASIGAQQILYCDPVQGSGISPALLSDGGAQHDLYGVPRSEYPFLIFRQLSGVGQVEALPADSARTVAPLPLRRGVLSYRGAQEGVA